MPRDKRKPLAFGRMTNTPMRKVDDTYYANDGRVDSVTFYANGFELANEVADYRSIDDLNAAAIPAGQYATCRAYGAIKFGAEHNERLLADVVNTNAGYFLPPEEEEPRQPSSSKSARDVIANVNLPRLTLGGLQEDEAALIVAALDAAGLVVVPKEPTEEMIEAGEDTDCTIETIEGYPEREEQIANFYRAMIAKAQEPKP